jgi:protein phosphatase
MEQWTWPPPIDEVLDLVEKTKPLFSAEPSMVEVNSKDVVFVGDTHGDSISSTYVLRRFPLYNNVLVFLGDYVDRGPEQLRNILLLLQQKLSFPDRIVLLRGNHETQEVNVSYGFYAELMKEYGDDGYKLFEGFNRLFSFMPYACLVNNSVLAVHGGLASGVSHLDDIRALPRGEVDPIDSRVVQLLWNDPHEEVAGFVPNPNRGQGSFLFGRDIVRDFERTNKLSLVVRSHCPDPAGFRYMFPRYDGSTTVRKGQYAGEMPRGLSSAWQAVKRLKSIAMREVVDKLAHRPGYPGLLLSIFTCRYYEEVFRPKVALLVGGRMTCHSLPTGS